ncbi:hypothetical protein SNE40_014453 [Patella caerulea]|uniref:Helicase ARIP4 n=1 Tax=Patella caerulea TaxID=87958 RepID=A0AAN8JIC2_PATCE
MASGDPGPELETNSKLTDMLSSKLNYDSYIGEVLPEGSGEENSILEDELFGQDAFLNEDDVQVIAEATEDSGEGGSCSNQGVDIIEDDDGSDWEEGDDEDKEDESEGEEESSGGSEEEDEEGDDESDESELLDEEKLDQLESELGVEDGDEIISLEKSDETPTPEGETTAVATTSSASTKPASTSTKKRKRKKEKKEKSKKKLKNKSNFKRKNIRQIISEKDLDKDTLAAQNEEFERKRRLNELKKSLVQKQVKEEKDSELKSLLQAAEDEATEASKNDDVILLDNKDLDKEHEKEIITLSSDEDEDIVMVRPNLEEDIIEEEDMNNAGSHIDDSINCRDEHGHVLVNLSHPPEDPDVYLAPQIARAIKPHQIGGVRFLYDNVVESLERHQTTPGFGCILAHSMGLGKTIQMISFIEIYLRYTKARSALCIVPINTLQNWMVEFNMWAPDPSCVPPGYTDVLPRNFKVFLLNDNYKTTSARAKVIGQWKVEGGVMLMGYEMYRLLSSKRSFPAKPKRSKKTMEPEIIDVDEEDKNKSLMTDIYGALVNPGPDIVICDEGHRIKNSHAGISQSLKNIKTRRRVVLTGYPLQNNLLEYWCMVDFVRPNFLGTKTEFSNMFERPMANGVCVDSTEKDLRLSRHRAYVLHSLLEGFVQRRGHAVLNSSLPEKQEYVFMIRMSPIQRALYNKFMASISDTGLSSWANNNPLKSFSVCCKIWNHPDVLYKIVTQKKQSADDDLDLEGNEGKKKSKKDITTDGMITYEWADDLMKDYIPGILEHSGKMVFLNTIIEESLAIGDKILVFSQSLFTLNLIEEYLSQRNVPRPDMNEKWCKNRSYFRLDGSTSAQEREKLINQFNLADNNTSWLFLLSTRAGCLGINLIGANRVIVLDASWNPCHDCQAICRVFRFGQKKKSYIYRFVTENTLERKIYDRQVNKQKMSDRVVDDLNPDNMRRTSNDLLVFQDRDYPEVDFSDKMEKHTDPVILNVLNREGKWLTEPPFTHESLLLDRKELRLSKREKQLAKEGYARDKKMSVTYSRPSYAAFYPNRGGVGLPIIRNQQGLPYTRGAYVRPVASVKPMISTPLPIGFKAGGKLDSPLGNSIMRPGVSVHQVITTTEIVLPGSNTATQAGAVNRIPPGQKVLVIKTLKGVYIRTADKKLFAVRSKTLPGPSMAPPGPLNLSSSAITTLSASQPTGLTRPIPSISSSTATSSSPANLNIKIVSSGGAAFNGKEKKIVINRNNNSAMVKAFPKPSTQSKSPIAAELLQSEMLSTIYSQTDTVNALLRDQDSENSSEASSSDKPNDTNVTFTGSSRSSTNDTASIKTNNMDGGGYMVRVNPNPLNSVIDNDSTCTKDFDSLNLSIGSINKPVGISKPAASTVTTSQDRNHILGQTPPNSSSQSNSMDSFPFSNEDMNPSASTNLTNQQYSVTSSNSTDGNISNFHGSSRNNSFSAQNSGVFNATNSNPGPNYNAFQSNNASSDPRNAFSNSRYYDQEYNFGGSNSMNKMDNASEILDLCNQYGDSDSQDYNLQNQSANSISELLESSSERTSQRVGPPNMSVSNHSENNMITDDTNTSQNNTTNASANSNNPSYSQSNQGSSNNQSSYNNFGNNYNPMGNFGHSNNFNNSTFNSGMQQASPMMDQNYVNPYTNMPANPFFPYFPQHNYPMMGQTPGMGMHMGGMPLMSGFNPGIMGGIQPQMMSQMSSPTTSSSQQPTEQPATNTTSSPQVPMHHQGMYGMPYMNTPMNPFMYNNSPNSMYMPMMNPFSSVAAQQINSIASGMNQTPNQSHEQSSTGNMQTDSNPVSTAK